MKYANIKEALTALAIASQRVEEVYIENGGEVTEETETLEAEREALRELLTGEGIDTLGRWLKSKEDEKAALKAEKAKIDAAMKAVDRTIDFIKEEVGVILRATDTDKAKGLLYSFAQYTSVTTKAKVDVIKERYFGKATEAVRAAGIPDYITLTLGASVSLVPEGEALPDVFDRNEVQTSKFTKPRAVKGAGENLS